MSIVEVHLRLHRKISDCIETERAAHGAVRASLIVPKGGGPASILNDLVVRVHKRVDQQKKVVAADIVRHGLILSGHGNGRSAVVSLEVR